MKPLLSLALLTFTAGCGGSTPDGSPALLTAVEPSYLFDTVAGTPPKHLFYFTNEGGQTTETLTASLSGDIAQFTITRDDCSHSALPKGHSCGVEVQLAGDVAEDYVGQLHVGTDTLQATVTMSGRVSPSQLVVSAPPINSVHVGGTAQAVVKVSNSGGAATGLLAIDDPGHAVIKDDCSGTQLKGNGSCSLTVQVTSALTDTGPLNVQVTLDENGGAPLPIVVPFTVTLDPPPSSNDAEMGAQDPTDFGGMLFGVYAQDLTSVASVHLTLSGGDENAAGTSPFVLSDNRCDGATFGANMGCTAFIGLEPALPAPADFQTSLIVTSLGRTPLIVPVHVHTTKGHVTVTLSTTGNGLGYISDPVGGFCGQSVDQACGGVLVGDGAPTTFQAYGVNTSQFVRWSAGPCAGSTSYTCVVTPNGMDFALAAEFTLQ